MELVEAKSAHTRVRQLAVFEQLHVLVGLRNETLLRADDVVIPESGICVTRRRVL